MRQIELKELGMIKRQGIACVCTRSTRDYVDERCHVSEGEVVVTLGQGPLSQPESPFGGFKSWKDG